MIKPETFQDFDYLELATVSMMNNSLLERLTPHSIRETSVAFKGK